MSVPPPTVFLVDDDASVRKAMSRLLKSAGHRVESFDSARAFLESGRRDQGTACLVLDVQMPELSGPDLQRELQAANTVLPVIFVTGHGDIPMSVRAMKAGAVDFLAKPVQQAELLRAVDQALARAAHEGAERMELDAIRRLAATLTPREHEVMSLVVTGMLNKQIADKLGAVEKTIKVHRGRVMEKMQVQSLAELVRVAERVGIPKKLDPLTGH
jgi:FixJ family two-component response regulator